MVEAMLRGWRAQQAARGLREDTADDRERLVRRFLAFTNEYPWQWGPGQVDEWTLSLTSRAAPGAVDDPRLPDRLRLFSEYLTDARYGWALACEEAVRRRSRCRSATSGTRSPTSTTTRASPEARPFTREELQRFLDYADEQVDRAVEVEAQGGVGRLPGRHLVQGDLRVGAAPHGDREAGPGRLGPQPGGAGVRPVRDAARPLRQGGARPAATAAQRRLGDGLGGGGGRGLRGQHPAAVRRGGSSRRCG